MSITQERKIELEKQRREQILGAALGLFFENGYANTTMSDIAVAAGISKGLIYHYFKNKAEVLFSYEENLQECLDEIALLPTPKATIREFGRRFLLRELDESGYIPPLQVFVIVFARGEMDHPEFADRNPLYKDLGRTYFGPLFKKGMELGEFKQGNPEVFGDIYWHYLLGNIMEIVQDRKNPNIATPDLDTLLDLFSV